MVQTTTQTDAKVKNKSTFPDSPIVKVSKTFSTTIEEVWKAWSDPALIQQWWGPDGCSSPSVKLDFHVGGKYLFAMKGPGENIIWSTGVYERIVPYRLITCTDQFADENGTILSPIEAGMSNDWVGVGTCYFTVEFQINEDDQVELHLTHEGIPAFMHDECVEGWNSSLNKLRALVEKH